MTDAAYALEGWHDLFVASAGAVAALSGLLFVALSINLREIFAAERESGTSFLIGRAIESLVDLLVVLGISLIALDPGLDPSALAAVILLGAACCAVSPVHAIRASRASHVKPVAFGSRLAVAFVLVALYVVAAVTLLAETGGGLHWLPFAFVLAISVAALNAWVLLVEVLR